MSIARDLSMNRRQFGRAVIWKPRPEEKIPVAAARFQS